MVPLYQKPGPDYPFVALFPTSFVVGDDENSPQKLPDSLLPKMHINYENRARDAHDTLPKYRKWPWEGEMTNDGVSKEEPLTSVKSKA